MKNLYNTFKKSIYNPAFYQEVTNASLSDTLRYYAKSVLVLSMVMTIGFGIFLGVAGTTFIRKYAPDLVKNFYPPALAIHIENGQSTANVSMPYAVPVKNFINATTTDAGMQNLLVIDTTHDFDKKAFDGYKTYALLTKTELVTTDSDGRVTMQSLRGIPTVTISQTVLLYWIEQIRHYLGIIIAVGVIAMFVLFMSGFLAYLLVLFLLALIPLLIAWIKKTPLSYGGAYKMSVYAIVPALVVKTALNLLGLLFLPAYLTLLVFMLVIAINMRNETEPKLFEN